jgi:NAD(P) transhydrogenase subunit alpha
MKEKLPLVINDAKEISAKATELSIKLQEMTENIVIQGNSNIDPLVYAVTIFTLACFIGYYVVWKVTPSLHTPLMSVTNAISGIVIIGALIAASSVNFGIASVFGFFATFLAAINIFGGFIVTQRMLEMFKKKS